MDIRNRTELKSFARQRLGQAREEKTIVLIFTAIVVGLAAAVTLVNYLLGLWVDQLGGLGSLGMRSVLSALQTLLPVLRTVVAVCLELGYMAAMLRIARGQYASPKTLRLGFDRFWPLLRLTILKGLIFLGIGLACTYLASFLYLLTPLSDGAMEILTPLMNQASLLDSSGLALDDATLSALTSAMVPALILCAGLYAIAALPVWYQYRMAEYLLIDRPAAGALAVLRESRQIMKGNRVQLFRLDVSFWWYYLAIFATGLLCYGDVLLPMVGIQFPWSETVGYFLFLALSLVAQAAVYYFLRNRVEVTYALAYDAVKPPEKESGVVLGNIFNL